jgi:hypothetical protein
VIVSVGICERSRVLAGVPAGCWRALCWLGCWRGVVLVGLLCWGAFSGPSFRYVTVKKNFNLI